MGTATPKVGWLLEAPGPSGDAVQAVQAVASLVSTVRAAVAEYQTPAYYSKQQACLAMDVSWEGPAEQWERALLACVRQPSKGTR